MGNDWNHQAGESQRAHPRKVLIARIEANWEDPTGATCLSRGLLEDVSIGGAAIRLRHPLEVGATVGIKWPRDEFSGVVRYCRFVARSGDGLPYVIGVERLSPKTA